MKNELRKIIEKAILESFGSQSDAKALDGKADFEMSTLAKATADKPEINVDYPKNETFGDYTTNVAMVLAKELKKSPMEIAEKLSTVISHQSSTRNIFGRIEVVAPGYINFHLSEKYLQNIIEEVAEKKEKFIEADVRKNSKICNEFISANPTGPLHLGNARGGFYGDVITRVLRKRGYEASNEYYINDAGEQVLKLGHSVLKDDQAVYGGEYIDALNEKYGRLADVKEVGEKAAEFIVENIIKKTVSEKMQISFDVWMSEKFLHDNSYVEKAIEKFKKREMTYEKDGALWLRTTDFGDDKDRVLIKSDGQKTYFASDCGYILSKIERGFDKIIEIWGADHHGYVERFRAAANALGFEGEIKFLIMQLVRLVKDGKEVRMSKRAGNVVYVDDLIDELGHDVTRFFFLMYAPETHMNFDLGIAAERSANNPVFYVQYAHARICSILGKIQDPRSKIQEGDANLALLVQEKELALMKEIAKLPEMLDEIAENYEVHKLPQFAIRLADKFHSFYNDCKVIDEENPDLTRARIALIGAVKIVLAETLSLIGVDAPEKM